MLPLVEINPGLYGAIGGLGIALVIYGPFVVIGSLWNAAHRSGSYLRRDGQAERLYGPPPIDAVCLVLFLAQIAFFIAILLWRNPLFNSSPNGDHARITFAKILILCIPVLALACWGAVLLQRRWYVLRLDLEQRTYRSFGSGVLPTPWFGTWNDIVGVGVRRVLSGNKRNVLCYQVNLQWREVSNVYATLGSFTRQDQADAYAERTARELHLPVVEAPGGEAKFIKQ